MTGSLRLGLDTGWPAEPFGESAGPEGWDRGRAADLLQRVAGGTLDAALVDAAAAQRWAPEVELVPGAAVSSFGKAGLAFLVHAVPLERVTAIASGEPESAPALLARLLFRAAGRPIGVVPETPAPAATVALLRAAPGPAPLPPGARALDLGQVWTDLTGLPFVWAVWVCRKGRLDRPLYGAIHGAIRAARSRSRAAWPEGLFFRLGRAELAGLARFGEEAAALGLAPARPPLRPARLAAATACDAKAARRSRPGGRTGGGGS
ncbi:MAG: hypothetical protein D6718_06475 [Acidobacteria bacterium]|nr:MAG: hypothetical protein D6718_06475 [Acidobacteriota bacterium]